MDIEEQKKLEKQLVIAYLMALKSLDVKHILYAFHPDFRFKYPLTCTYGSIYTDLRYLGYLCRTFHELKQEGYKINAECSSHIFYGMEYPCLLLHPPYDLRIAFPLLQRYRKESHPTNTMDVVALHFHIRQGKIFKIETVVNPHISEGV